jgi:hypothetical protein
MNEHFAQGGDDATLSLASIIPYLMAFLKLASKVYRYLQKPNYIIQGGEKSNSKAKGGRSGMEVIAIYLTIVSIVVTAISIYVTIKSMKK